MAIGLNVYKAIGCIYKIDDIELTKKGFKKRKLFLEIPTASGENQKSEVVQFSTLGDDVDGLEWYNEGEWVEIMFRLGGRFWKPPDRDEKIHFNSLTIADIHKTDNPFESQERINIKPEDLSPDVVNELAKNVKDWRNEEAKQDVLFEEKDDNEQLPF